MEDMQAQLVKLREPSGRVWQDRLQSHRPGQERTFRPTCWALSGARVRGTKGHDENWIERV